jgi:hypothetical protein
MAEFVVLTGPIPQAVVVFPGWLAPTNITALVVVNVIVLVIAFGVVLTVPSAATY